MADKELNMENSPPTNDRHRSSEHKPPGARRLEGSRDHKSVQTEKVPVRHTGVQFESPTHSDMDITDRQLSALPSQTAGNCTNSQMSIPPFETVANPADTEMSVLPSQTVANCANTQVVHRPPQTVANPADIQMTAASSVNVGSSSGTQIGDRNSIVHNNPNNSTYKINNNTFNIFVTELSPSQLTELVRSLEQTADSGEESSASHHSDVTNEALNSNSIRKIKTVTSRTVTPNESQVLDDQVQTVTSQSNHLCSSDSDVQPQETGGMQSTQQDQTKSSEQRCQTKRKIPDSSSLNANPLSDVTNTGDCRTAQGNVTDVKGQQATCSNEQNDSRQTPTGHGSAKSTPSISIQDSVCIIDCNGRTLEPGDVVRIGDIFTGVRAIYIGHQQVVLCRGRGELVEKRELNLTQPFGKWTIQSGECRVFPPQERVERSMSRVGTHFTETDGRGWWRGEDFTFWVATGLGYFQARSRGFRLY